MDLGKKQVVRAAKASMDRLFQVRQLWEDAANSYFEPDRFVLSLQSCITTARTVTFILQSNKDGIPDFDAWYEQQRQKWNADPIMRWARDARNSIEKRGDLETHSQVRGEIIASYMQGPHTCWLPSQLFAGPKALWRAVPAKYRVPHVLEHGTLLVERRWVDNELPDMEVLEALAHVYEQFCDTIIDLLERNDIAVPPQLARSRPDAMGELAMDRAIYLSMADGSERGLRYAKKPMQPPQGKAKAKVEKRYGAFGGGWQRLKDAENLREVAAAFFENARAVMRRDGFHHSLTFLMKGMLPIEMVRTDHPDRATRYVLMRDLARLARIAGADGVMMIGEAWTARSDQAPPSGFAVDAPNRGESIMLHGADAKGDGFVFSAEVERKRPGSRKVKRVGAAELSSEGFQFILLPFFEEWGCIDEKALKRALAKEDEMGIKRPSMGSAAPDTG